ncbi:alkanesulfonate monooxygenase SsuD/methylene tetrahydromethanopterin reductase-like flavin-dependent oxidoreductase (luciferase family) [Saccharomonospora amisosensis]|uniref:Alkanesulfonate monooxygenase SsuD/methylene tetrahydromethanopterin reductase-like flavin-dependent oxidoreductase (Luciferase family) n=1 Tax=Saccharomonospora amisosensis TaxID=1128677 RepID=A0A7X5URS0_9PSEU|nr:LLM class flavin-dependent oxidoreductase [Saccharomonospora amisosensis]NIJ12554.1 alkanesulfonate monooxygenase SsuD/methylene tetrahydromethanopterin reductase-like flavin-dependent oxidoreductase (luciferase family) [Saccharomonospora amisosensis]
MLHIGINLGFAAHPELTDEDMYHSELDLAVHAETLGYDSVWLVEHHFTDYSLCPDNLLLLAHLAGRTSRIKLGTAAVILPWNNPLRVAEKALMVDTVSRGRLLLGIGRGLSRKEYEPFRIPLEQTRDRFDEAAPMIFEALESGIIEGAGPFYPQPGAQLRPRPRGSFHGRRYCVAGSPDSVVMAAKLRAKMMSFIVKPVPDLMPTFNHYRELYETEHGELAPPIALNVNMYCHSDDELARERHFEHVNRFFMSNVEHYEMAGEHFARIKGHERYAANAAYFREIGLEKAANNYAATALWGNPERILGQIEAIRDVLGDFELTLAPSFGGMPYDQARASLELFAREVLPKARGLRGKPVSVAV